MRICDGLCEAGLETAVAYQGEGHAPIATATWARAVRASKQTPLYSTDWENGPSRKVAAKLNLAPYAEDLAID